MWLVGNDEFFSLLPVPTTHSGGRGEAHCPGAIGYGFVGSFGCVELGYQVVAGSVTAVDVELTGTWVVGYFGLFALQDYLEKLLGCPVDLGTPDSLKPYIKESVMGELIRVT